MAKRNKLEVIQVNQALKKLENLDPRASGNQLELLENTFNLINDMVAEARELDAEDMDLKMKAVNCSIKYREMMNKDPFFIVQELMQLDDKRIDILTESMKYQGIVSNFIKGEMDMGYIYNLPKKLDKDSKKKKD